MIIFPDKAVYIHVPKTAGSAFEEMCWHRHKIAVSGMQHGTARDIPKEAERLWTFGFLRDPVMAEVSDWRYHKFAWGQRCELKEFTFENWCRWRFEDDPEFGRRFGINEEDFNYGIIWNVRPQAGYFCDEEGVCIADAIFRYEELEESLKIASDIIGLDLSLPPSTKLGSALMTYEWSQGRENYSQHVTDRAVEALRKGKGLDFLIHGTSGPVLRNFKCPTVPSYAYTR